MARYTEQDIERSIRTVASLIDRFGDVYWPILERLEHELESRRSRAARLQRYLRAEASGNDPLEITVFDFKPTGNRATQR
ncbi:MAG: hypothetical protein AAFY25_07095 [Pseudomonadota bacterium]